MRRKILNFSILAFLLCSFSVSIAATSYVGSSSSGLKGRRKVYLINAEQIINPALGTNIYCTENRSVTSANVNDITGVTNPDVARKVKVTLGGTAASIPANATTNITPYIYENRDSAAVSTSYWIIGTDINGNAIGESLGFSENTTGSVTSTYAYKTITEIHLPAMDGDGVTVDVGVTDALGISGQIDSPEQIVHTFVNGTYESTRATVTTSNVVAGCTIDPNTALDDAKHVDVVYFTDFY